MRLAGLLCPVALVALACSSSPSVSTDAGPDDTCSVTADCAWGEIDHEILSAADCPCLLGCPHLVESKTVVNRRQAQYGSLCTPDKDGQGNPCPIDDCAMPPALECNAGRCAVAQVDGGR